MAASNGKIYAIGGRNFDLSNPLATVEEYDPAADAWTTQTSIFFERAYLKATESNGKIYAIGGSVHNQHPGFNRNRKNFGIMFSMRFVLT